MRVLILTLALGLVVACSPNAPDVNCDDGGCDHGGPSVGTVVGWEACSTEAVIGLSRQIADEMECIRGNLFESFPRDGDDYSFNSNTTLPLLPKQAMQSFLSLAKDFHQRTGEKVIIESGFRTVVQQHLLYSWHNEGKRTEVYTPSSACSFKGAPAFPGNSNHEKGQAFDIAVAQTERFSEVAAEHQWARPHTWDKVHFEQCVDSGCVCDSSGCKRASFRKHESGLDVEAFQRLWNRNHPAEEHFTVAEFGIFDLKTKERLNDSPSEGFLIGACGADLDAPTGHVCTLSNSDEHCTIEGVESWCEITERDIGFCSSDCEGLCEDTADGQHSYCADFNNDGGSCVRQPSTPDGCNDVPGSVLRVTKQFNPNGTTGWKGVCVPEYVPQLRCQADDGAVGVCIDEDVMACNNGRTETITGECPGLDPIRCCIPDGLGEGPDDEEEPRDEDEGEPSDGTEEPSEPSEPSDGTEEPSEPSDGTEEPGSPGSEEPGGGGSGSQGGDTQLPDNGGCSTGGSRQQGLPTLLLMAMFLGYRRRCKAAL